MPVWLADVLSHPGTLLPVVVTAVGVGVSVLLFRLNRRNMRITVAVSIMKQMQDYNLQVARDDTLAEPMQKGELFGYTLAWIRELYATFYQLNIIHDAWFAHRSKLLSSDHTLTNTGEILCLLATRSPTQMQYILNGRRGYNEKFKRYIRAQLSATEEHHRLRVANDDRLAVLIDPSKDDWRTGATDLSNARTPAPVMPEPTLHEVSELVIAAGRQE